MVAGWQRSSSARLLRRKRWQDSRPFPRKRGREGWGDTSRPSSYNRLELSNVKLGRGSASGRGLFGTEAAERTRGAAAREGRPAEVPLGAVPLISASRVLQRARASAPSP